MCVSATPVDVDVVEALAELREDAVSAVHEQPRVALLDEVPAARAARVLPRRRLAEHGDPQRSTGPFDEGAGTLPARGQLTSE